MSARSTAAAGTRAALATPHTAATEAGAAAFAAGGNAVDAALAAAATLAVVDPHQCGVGGDLFTLVAGPDGSVVALNASGPAPRAIDPSAIGGLGDRMPEFGPATVTVPGAVAGWGGLHALGASLPFGDAFGEAVRLARDGVPAVRFLAERLAGARDRLAADPGMAEVFYPRGRPLAVGEPFRQPALAETLEAIASEGPATLFVGPTGERLADGLRRLGSTMTLEDLAAFEPEVGPPLPGRYRDLEVLVVPPNSQGFTLLEILALVERLGIDPDPLGPDAEIVVATFEAAAAERDRYNADPRFAPVPVEELLGDAHLDAMCRAIRNGDRPPSRPAGGGTVALVAADGEGRMVSLVQSLWSSFGSGLLEPSTGIVLHNRGADFSLDAASPNALAGGKRPAHTLLPVLVRRDGRPVAAGGSRGGGGQPQINYASLVRTFDLGMPAAEALDAPRYLVGGMDLHPTRYAEVEAAVPDHVVRALRAAGYAVTTLAGHSDRVGHAHLIVRGADGSYDVGTDPRADGSAWAR